jgi:hypothetical protein
MVETSFHVSVDWSLREAGWDFKGDHLLFSLYPYRDRTPSRLTPELGAGER